MVRTKIQQTKEDQYRTTLPKALIESRQAKGGDYLEWTMSDGKLVAEIIRK